MHDAPLPTENVVLSPQHSLVCGAAVLCSLAEHAERALWPAHTYDANETQLSC